MNKTKHYAASSFYETKLAKVMARFGVEDYNFNFDRLGAFVEFRYKGDLFRFDHSIAKAQEHNKPIRYGSDAFSQIVLALEDLARMVEMGIYDLATWVAGMRFLPPPIEIPNCFRVLGFETMPTSKADIQSRYRTLAKQYHPDTAKGEDGKDFEIIKRAAEQALKHFEATA